MLAGLALAWWVVRDTGWSQIARAAERIGVGGFTLYGLYSVAVFVLLGAAWWVVAPGERAGRLVLFAWARLVREGVADLLPLSQVGGLVAGARVLRRVGVPGPRLYSSMIADQATEMASQLVFTLFGLMVMASLLAGAGGAALRPAMIGGTLALLALALVFLLGQRRMLRLAAGLARRVLPGAAETLAAVEAELARLYTRRGRVAASFALNLLAWIASAMGAWIVLALIGHRLPVWWVLSIEAAIAMVRSVAFAVPGAIGFQEAAYALLGPLFGLPPAAALALSLARRARDILLGLIGLVSWQLVEAAGWRSRRRTRGERIAVRPIRRAPR